jgi:hypothetical protein
VTFGPLCPLMRGAGQFVPEAVLATVTLGCVGGGYPWKE